MSAGMSFAVVLGAYLLGSISFSYLIVKIKEGKDVRTLGSGNAGATNVMRASGKGPAILALLLDVAKGVTAVTAARALGAATPVVGGAALAVVLGHVFPIFFGFRGGKGVATSAGALGALAPVAMLLALLVFLVMVLWKRYVSLGSMAAAAVFPLMAWAGHRLGWVEHGDPWVLISSAGIALLILIKHRSNLERLRQGVEPRLGERRTG
ncbi:MAG TPA: glycerol-3-phosphate 1-O-acyltransferase PlsY [Thermoanaerobaculia bacterium]